MLSATPPGAMLVCLPRYASADALRALLLLFSLCVYCFHYLHTFMPSAHFTLFFFFFFADSLRHFAHYDFHIYFFFFFRVIFFFFYRCRVRYDAERHSAQRAMMLITRAMRPR